jgi:hypothetical protein
MSIFSLWIILLQDFFRLLEHRKTQLGVTDLQMGLTTLEEVFLTITKQADLENAAAEGRVETLTIHGQSMNVSPPTCSDICSTLIYPSFIHFQKCLWHCQKKFMSLHIAVFWSMLWNFKYAYCALNSQEGRFGESSNKCDNWQVPVGTQHIRVPNSVSTDVPNGLMVEIYWQQDEFGAMRISGHSEPTPAVAPLEVNSF